MSDNPVFDMPPVASGFDIRSAWVMRQLMSDVGVTPEQAAGIIGNLGGESGMTAIQEGRPLAGRGGFGWAQWTGDRRVAFEKYCADHGWSVISDEANYGFLVEELKGSQAHSLEQVKKTSTVDAATYTFEVYYERPSDLQSQLQKRIDFGNRALASFNDPTGTKIPPKPKPKPLPVTPPQPQPTPAPSTSVGGMLGSVIAASGPWAIPAKALVDTIAALIDKPWFTPAIQLEWIATLVLLGGALSFPKVAKALGNRIVKDLS